MKTIPTWTAIALCAVAAPVVATGQGTESEMADALRALRAVRAHGEGNAVATEAWNRLSRLEAMRLPGLLEGMNEAGPLTANWIATAIDAVAERALSNAQPLPLSALGGFLFDTGQSARARRLALDLIQRADSRLAASLLGGLLDDPATELRREAVQALLDQANTRWEAKDFAGATVLHRQAIRFARDADQVEALAKRLREQGQPVDIAHLFAWVRDWYVLGPFDNRERKGFDTAFEPERRVALRAEIAAMNGPARWTRLVSTNEFGLVDLNQPFGALKEVVGYAYTELESSRAQPAEIRLGCKNAWKIWLNDRLVFARDEYHAGMEIDQYRLPVELAAGRNRLLVKLCQNEQKEEWTVEWEFQLRVCDPQGAPLRLAQPTLTAEHRAAGADRLQAVVPPPASQPGIRTPSLP